MIKYGILAFDRDIRPERLCAGLSLLERGIRTMARAGIKHLLVVVPKDATVKLNKITRHLDIQLEIVTWGTESLQVFQENQDVLLLLGDHVHHHTSLSQLTNKGLQGADMVVQTSNAPNQNLPLYSVTLDKTIDFQSSVEEIDCPVATGAFLCSSRIAASELTTKLTVEDSGDKNRFREATDFLSFRTTGMQVISTNSNLDLLWRRVIDRKSSRQAKSMLFSHVTKSTSGPVSRHINARLSIPTSKLLIETGISPHLVTVLFVMPTGLMGAYLISRPDNYLCFALAGLFWQLAAVFDRCDGEIARVQLSESKFGAWFDTLTDNFAYLCGYVGFLLGINRLYGYDSTYMYLAFSAVGAMLITLILMYTYAIKTGSGSLQNYFVGFSRHVPAQEKGFLYRIFERYGFLAKRDFFSFIFLLCCFSDAFLFLYWYTVGGLHLLAIGVLMSQKKMIEWHKVYISNTIDDYDSTTNSVLTKSRARATTISEPR